MKNWYYSKEGWSKSTSEQKSKVIEMRKEWHNIAAGSTIPN
jgi:hypothetical protein